MKIEDWIVMIGTLLFIVGYGTWKTRKNRNIEDYLRGGNEARWWTVGLSVMATQASAITFLSTPGQAFHDGMGFVQFYFGLPIAVVIICAFFIPIYHKLKVYTAYEYLETRFDRKTRTLTAILFLIQRGLGAGITIFAPAIVLSAVLGWNLKLLNLAIGTLVVLYTVSGGTRAVNVTQKQQMFVIMAGMITAFCLIVNYLPDDITFGKAIEIAGANDKMKVLDFTWDLNERYTVWTGILGGTFLMLSYFGTDQSQVQRYLSARSSKQAKIGLIFNALLKIPMQFFILLVGIMVFVFFQFNPTPLNFNPRVDDALSGSAYATEYEALKDQQAQLFQEKQDLTVVFTQWDKGSSQYNAIEAELGQLNIKEKELRAQTKALVAIVDDDIERNDKDYVFIHFILTYLPKGLIGLLLAMILSAAMSSTASELNALATTTAVDLYKANHKEPRSEKHYLSASRWFTLMWGVIAILFASFGELVDNLIQLVNIVGSIFYGTVLGIFLVAFFLKWIGSRAIFIAALISQTVVFIFFAQEWLEYLWLNALGAGVTVTLAILLQGVIGGKKS